MPAAGGVPGPLVVLEPAAGSPSSRGRGRRDPCRKTPEDSAQPPAAAAGGEDFTRVPRTDWTRREFVSRLTGSAAGATLGGGGLAALAASVDRIGHPAMG